MKARQFLANTFYSLRQTTIDKLTSTTRDYDWECGYPLDISVTEYKDFYDRWGIATRAVQVWPEESWAVVPQILEDNTSKITEFEQAFLDLQEDFNIIGFWNRVDVLSGIGRFGTILLGLDDGLALNKPVNARSARKLLYLRAFDESKVKIDALEEDIRNERFGKPVMYSVKMSTKNENDESETKVHWSRMIHIADNKENNEIYGVPRLQALYNHIWDIRKIGGGSAEMFWKGGFPGLGITVDPNLDLENVTVDTDVMKDEIEKYAEGLKRYLVLTGATANTLNPNVADPRGHFEVILKLITIGLGVPLRIFLGSEAAKLASIQDKKTWQGRVAKRQQMYLTPDVVRLTIDRFIKLGILPEPSNGYKIVWPDLEDPSEADLVKTALARTNALSIYAKSGASKMISPKMYLKIIQKMSEQDLEAIEDDLPGEIEIPDFNKAPANRPQRLPQPGEMEIEEPVK